VSFHENQFLLAILLLLLDVQHDTVFPGLQNSHPSVAERGVTHREPHQLSNLWLRL
jgi:hypothetical protein